MVRGAFEYQGQKCSAASRAYIPRSLWSGLRDGLATAVEEVGVGDVADFRNFMGVVITQASFDQLRAAIEEARSRFGAEIQEVIGGACDDSTGWFVGPTVIVTGDPSSRTMCEELFGPVITVYVYDDADFNEILDLCDRTSPYALTGAVFARDRQAIGETPTCLRFAAGNFYINDKPTRAVVGQQPFGGSRSSGTNDKVGSQTNLLRWPSTRRSNSAARKCGRNIPCRGAALTTVSYALTATHCVLSTIRPWADSQGSPVPNLGRIRRVCGWRSREVFRE